MLIGYTKHINMSKKKVLYIVFGVLAGILAVAGIAIAFLANYDDIVPGKAQVIDNGSEIFFKSDFNEYYKGYRFKFENNGNVFTFDSTDNMLSLEKVKDKLVFGQEYHLSTCFLGDNEGGNSKYSEKITFLATKYLDQVSLQFNQKENTLSWPAVEGADFYEVYVNGQKEKVTQCNYNLFLLKGGSYNFEVVAKSEKSFLKASKASKITTLVKRNFAAFKEVNFDKENCLLTIFSSERVFKIDVQMSNEIFAVEDFDEKIEGDKFIYTIDLKLKYNKQTRIGAKPSTLDENNISLSQFVMAEI